jgi:hypothetical protein
VSFRTSGERLLMRSCEATCESSGRAFLCLGVVEQRGEEVAESVI